MQSAVPNVTSMGCNGKLGQAGLLSHRLPTLGDWLSATQKDPIKSEKNRRNISENANHICWKYPRLVQKCVGRGVRGLLDSSIHVVH